MYNVHPNSMFTAKKLPFYVRKERSRQLNKTLLPKIIASDGIAIDIKVL